MTARSQTRNYTTLTDAINLRRVGRKMDNNAGMAGAVAAISIELV